MCFDITRVTNFQVGECKAASLKERVWGEAVLPRKTVWWRESGSEILAPMPFDGMWRALSINVANFRTLRVLLVTAHGAHFTIIYLLV